MTTLLDILRWICTLYVGIALLRFLLQLAQADYYNPISQIIVKATRIPVQLLRKVIPTYRNLDFASFLWTLLVSVSLIEVLVFFDKGILITRPIIVLWALIGIANLALTLFMYGLLIVVILSWVAPQNNNPGVMLIRQLIEPAMRPIRELLPNLGGLDFSPILAFFLITFLQNFVIYKLVNANLSQYLPGFL